jgi:hypothetical protein
MGHVAQHFHVTSSANRDSIARNGLDWRHMGFARGIAGSLAPEQAGCFLCRDDSEAEWFVRMNNTGGDVDVWAVDGIIEASLLESPEGFAYLPAVIPPGQLTLVRPNIPPERR